MPLTLEAAPVHEEAVAQAAEHAHDPHGARIADAAAVVVVGNVQALVQAAFDAPGCAVELKPAGGIELLGSGAGEQGDFFGIAAAGVAQQPRGLAGKGEEEFLATKWRGLNGADFLTAFVLFDRARLGGRRFSRGENPHQGRRPVSGCCGVRWADCPLP